MKKTILLSGILMCLFNISHSQLLCDGCSAADLEANIIFNSLNNDDCTYTLKYPFLQVECDADYLIQWNGTSDTLTTLGQETSTTFQVSGLQDVNIYILRRGAVCGPYTFPIDVPDSCAPSPPAPCPTSNNIHYLDEVDAGNGNAPCWTGQASLTGFNTSQADYVNWDWALGGYTGTGAGHGFTTPIYYPTTQNWDFHFIVIGATVVNKDGSVCPRVWNRFLLDCAPGNPFHNKANDNSLNIYPNPLKQNQELQFSGIDNKDVTKIEILDMLGNKKQSIQPTSRSLAIGNLKPGIYFVKFYTAKGIEQKKLIIE